MRSIWKGHFLKSTQSINKSSIIFNAFFKKKFQLHNGKELKELVIDRLYVGHKFGEFVFTRKVGQIHKKKIKSKGSKK